MTNSNDYPPPAYPGGQPGFGDQYPPQFGQSPGYPGDQGHPTGYQQVPDYQYGAEQQNGAYRPDPGAGYAYGPDQGAGYGYLQGQPDQGYPQSGAYPPAMGYAPGAPGVPMPPVQPRPLRGRAFAAQILLGSTAVLTVGLLLSSLFRASFVESIFNGGDYSDDQAGFADLAVSVTLLTQVALMIATGVCFILWMFRYVKNAQLLGHTGFGPGWTIGAWFIPLAGWIIPPTQLLEASRASKLDTPGTGQAPARGLIVGWAIFWAIANLTTSIANVLTPDIDAPTDDKYFADLITSDRLTAVASVPTAVAAVLAIMMVRSVTRTQNEAFAARMPAGGTPTMAPSAAGWQNTAAHPTWQDPAGQSVPSWTPQPPPAPGTSWQQAPPPPPPYGQ